MIVAGYPGRTYRYKLASEVRDAQEFAVPQSIVYRKKLISILEEQSAGDRTIAIRNASRLRGLLNILKKYEGTLQAFRSTNLLDIRGREEGARTAQDPTFASTVAEIDRLNQQARTTRQRDTLLSWLYDASPLLKQADTLYFLSRERAKADVDRRLGYQQRDWKRLRAGIARQQRSIDVPSDRAGLRAFLLETQTLPADQRITAVDNALANAPGESTEEKVNAFLDALYSGTKMASLEERQAMFEQPTADLLEGGPVAAGRGRHPSGLQ